MKTFVIFILLALVAGIDEAKATGIVCLFCYMYGKEKFYAK